MIAAWRICRAPHADLTGEGAKRLGGCWNGVGRPVVYLAEHPALAALEVLVHLDLPPDLLPEDYVLLRVDLPDEPPARLIPPRLCPDLRPAHPGRAERPNGRRGRCRAAKAVGGRPPGA